MRNLALQGEVRHLLPATRDIIKDSKSDFDDNDIGSACVVSDLSGNIVSVIQKNANADAHVGPDNFDSKYPQGGTHGNCNSTNEVSNNPQPPVSFVVTSDGEFLALDASDQLAWVVNLNKVAEDSNDDDGDGDCCEEGQDKENVMTDDALKRNRSQWFYAASFQQEHSSEVTGDDENADFVGTDIGCDRGLHVTCLSHDGHVVSVSIDDTNSIWSKRVGAMEDGSECIGSFENGLECGKWSPDGEVLALVTFSCDDEDDGNKISNHTDLALKVPILMTMNTQYEILSEVRLDSCLFPVDSDNTGRFLHPNAILLCWRPDSSSLAVSTMDAVDNNKVLRRIRTYHRTTLQIISLSKEEDGSGRDIPYLLPLEPIWAPAQCSHYVGAAQSSRPLNMKSTRARPNNLKIAFLEPNGLRHGECKIQNTVAEKTDKEDLTGIAFNSEGDLLAVISKVNATCKASNQQYEYGKVQLYHRSNYHWYLKYEVRYDGKGSPPSVVSRIQFSDDDPYKIVVALNRQQESTLEWREYSFRWDASTVYCCNTNLPTSSAVLATVIDGRLLNFSPLDKAIIPPPMCACSLEFPAPVIEITSVPFSNEKLTGDRGHVEFIITLSDGTLALLQSNLGGQNKMSQTSGFQPPSLLAIVNPFNIIASNETVDSGLFLQEMAMRDITIIDTDDDFLTVVALSCPYATDRKHCFADYIIEMKIACSPQINGEGPINTPADIIITCSVPLEGRALRLVNWLDTANCPGARGGALLQLTDGTLFEYSRGGMLQHCGAAPFLEPCPWITGVYDATASNAATTSSLATDDNVPQECPDESSARLVIGLSHRYRLYCSERLLSSASSSFFVSLPHAFVCHITIGSRPQFRFLSLKSLHDYDPLMGSDQNLTLEGYEPRSVESGA